MITKTAESCSPRCHCQESIVLVAFPHPQIHLPYSQQEFLVLYLLKEKEIIPCAQPMNTLLPCRHNLVAILFHGGLARTLSIELLIIFCHEIMMNRSKALSRNEINNIGIAHP